jgi:hypothetical protein
MKRQISRSGRIQIWDRVKQRRGSNQNWMIVGGHVKGATGSNPVAGTIFCMTLPLSSVRHAGVRARQVVAMVGQEPKSLMQQS